VRIRGVVLVSLALLLLSLPSAADALKFRRANGSIAVNPDNARPGNIGRDRAEDIIRSAAGFWNVPITGESTRVPGRLTDNFQVAGFANDLPPQALGVWNARYHNVYKRVRRCKRNSAGVLHCKRVRKYRYSLIDEADVEIAVRNDYNVSQVHPTRQTFDLLTVLIHEFGHFARPNLPHVHGCENSPLIDSLARGEWWWNTQDWFRFGCPNSPGPPPSNRRAQVPTKQGSVITRLHRGPDEVRP
jgi:hypothetical protein